MVIRRLFLRIKASLKKRSTIVVILSIIFLIAVAKSVTVPSLDNTVMGIVLNGSEEGEKIVDKLDTKDRIFNVKIYEDVDELKSDILSGKTECGFIFADDFDDMVEKRKLKKTVTYISSIYTTKGEIAKETVYGAFLDNYSEYILEDEYEKIFGEKNDEVMSELLELNALYKESSSIFTVDFEEGFR